MSALTLMISCQSDDPTPTPTPSPAPATPTATASSYFISYELDGVSMIQENGVDGYQIGHSNGSSTDGVNNLISVDPGSVLYNFQNATAPHSGIHFMNNDFALTDYSSDNVAALATIFTMGAHDYSLINTSTKGVQFDYSANNVEWSTEKMAQPSSSSFEITTSEASTNILGGDQREVKGTFNCKIYNDSGASKNITNGQFHLIYTAP